MLEPLTPRLVGQVQARLAELRALATEAKLLQAVLAVLRDRQPAPAREAAPAMPPAAVAAYRRHRDGRIRRDGIGDGTQRQQILELVRERPGVSVAELVAGTGIERATAAPLVSKLKREGVVVEEAGGVKLAARAPLTIASLSGDHQSS